MPPAGAAAVVRRLSSWLTAVGAAGRSANPKSVALRAKGTPTLYNLDRDVALAAFREAVSADPQDAAAYRGLATSLWLSITFRRGNMTVDDYLGRPNKPSTAPLPPAPPETITGFHDALEHARRRWPASAARQPARRRRALPVRRGGRTQGVLYRDRRRQRVRRLSFRA